LKDQVGEKLRAFIDINGEINFGAYWMVPTIQN